jgi:hypothetical protein
MGTPMCAGKYPIERKLIILANQDIVTIKSKDSLGK